MININVRISYLVCKLEGRDDGLDVGDLLGREEDKGVVVLYLGALGLVHEERGDVAPVKLHA